MFFLPKFSVFSLLPLLTSLVRFVYCQALLLHSAMSLEEIASELDSTEWECRRQALQKLPLLFASSDNRDALVKRFEEVCIQRLAKQVPFSCQCLTNSWNLYAPLSFLKRALPSLDCWCLLGLTSFLRAFCHLCSLP